MQRRRKVFLIVLCLVMNVRFISVGKCTDIMCVYGVLKILTRWCNMKGLPQRSFFFCAMSTRKIYGPFFFCEDTMTGTSYLEMLQTWLFPRLQEDEPENFIIQQDGAPPTFSSRRSSLVERRSSTSMDRAGCSWGLDVLFLACMVPWFNPLWLLPLGLREGQSVCATTNREHTWFEKQNYHGYGDITPDLLIRVWQELDCRLDVYRVTKGAHIETFVGMYHKLVELLFHFY